MPVITPHKIREAIASTSPDKVLGLDGILNRALRTAIDKLVPYLIRLFNRCLELRYYPTPFRDRLTVVLRKLGKETYRELKFYRLIALLNTLGKTINIIIARRLAYATERYSLLPKTYTGGRKATSTEHALYLVVE